MAQLEGVDVAVGALPQNLNREDVLQQISDISRIPLPFIDLIGTSTHTNPKFEWPVDRLRAPAANVVIDGSLTEAAAGSEEVAAAYRHFNYAQISQQTTGTSTRFETLNNVGNESLARQVQKSTQEVWRDVELQLLANNSNVLDTGTGGAGGETAGLEAWLDTDQVDGSTVGKSPATAILTTGTGAGGSVAFGGWSERTGEIIDIVDYTSLTALGALSFGDIQDVLDGLWQLGGNPTKIMARPSVIRKLSAYMFTSTAQIATISRDKNEMGPAQAQASVNQLITDFGIITDLVPNRLMGQTDSSAGTPPLSDTLFAFDPSYLKLSTAGGAMRAKELPRNGLARAIQVHIDWGLCVTNNETLGGIVGINDASAAEA